MTRPPPHRACPGRSHAMYAGFGVRSLIARTAPKRPNEKKRQTALFDSSMAGTDASATCTICLEFDPPAIRCGCACRGDSGLAHIDCLVSKAVWQEKHRGDAVWVTCQTCGQRFTGAMQVGLAENLWSRVCDLPRQSIRRLFGAQYRADCLGYEGHYEEALQINREVHDMLRQTLGAEHPDTLRSWLRMAEKLGNMGMHLEAEQVEREVHRVRRQSLGDEHPETLMSAEQLGRTLARQQKLVEAANILRLVHATKKRAIGDEHYSTLRSTYTLAHVLSDMGETAEAEQLMRAALRAQQRLLGEEHPDTLASADILVEILARREKHTEALTLAKSALDVVQRIYQQGHRTRCIFEHNLHMVQEAHNVAAATLARRAPLRALRRHKP